MSIQHIKIEAADARPGDEFEQGGEWHEIESVGFVRSSVVVRFVEGGSHSGPVEWARFRRAVSVVVRIVREGDDR